MRGNLVGVLASVLFILAGYLIHTAIGKKDSFLARKVLHIWVCNWFFIYDGLFDNSFIAMAGLLVFAAINLFLEISWFHTHRYGTVYYPLSIIALLCLCERGYGNQACLGCAILSMGYGDGLASIVGTRIKSRKMPFVYDKTVAGSLMVFSVTVIVVLIFMKCAIWKALLVGFAACIFEAYIPWSLDNIAVPAVVFFLVDKLC